MVARRNQRGSDGLIHLLAVHFLRHRKSSLSKTSLHFLVWKWLLADPDQEFRVVNHFENLNSPGLLFSPSSVQGDQQTKAPLPVHSLCSLHSAGIGGSRPRGRAANTRALPGPRTRAVAAVGHRALGVGGDGNAPSSPGSSARTLAGSPPRRAAALQTNKEAEAVVWGRARRGGGPPRRGGTALL